MVKLINNLIGIRDKPLNELLGYYLPTAIKGEISRHFPSYLLRQPIRPRTAGLNITDNCSLRCIMCNGGRNYSKDELDTEGWRDILRQLKEVGIRQVGFTGGEPLLHKDIVELVRYTNNLGLRVGIVTNGYLLTEKRAIELIEAGISNISISVDALGETYDYIRGVKGGFEKVHHACNTISLLKRRYNFGVKILSTIMKPTLNHIIDVVRFAESLGFPVHLNLLDYTPYFFRREDNKDLWIEERDQERLNRLVDELLEIKKEKDWLIGENISALNYIKDYFRDPLQKQIPCISSLTRIFISSSGEILGGCWSMGSMGDIRKSSLKEVINSSRYIDAHKRMFLKECPGCSCGYAVNLKYLLPSLVKNLRNLR
ncbi:MAG: radical SAM protein [Nitrospinae bacterium]|nr:radical SAM protein [Nitrospinota bacterium]